MLIEALVAAVHFVSILLAAMLLAAELALYRPALGAREARLLGRVDLLYFLAALAILGSGLLRVFAVGKGAAFYLENPVFYAKLGLFLTVALLSVPPTLHFLGWRKALAAGQQPLVTEREYRRVRRFLLAEGAVFFAIPWLAVALARGLGH
jgi:putative membrane protein